MPPSTSRNGRRTVSDSSSPRSSLLQSQSPSNQTPTALTASSTSAGSPSPIRRTVSASSAPYPTSRQAIVHARSSTRAHEQSRKVLAEIDWWVVMSGQRDEDEDEYDDEEEEEEEWEQWTMQEDEEPTQTANTQTDDDTLSEGSDGDDNIDDTTAELSTSHELSEENTDSSRAPSPFFPTTLPPLTPLLSSQVGSEPSRRDSRGRTTSRVYARRPVESGITRLTWDYSTSSMVVTSVPPPTPSTTTTIGTSPTAVASSNININRARTPTPSPANAISTPSTPSSPSQGRASSTTPSPCRAQSLCRAFGAAPGSVADSILREAFSTPPSVSLSTSKSNNGSGGSRIIDKANSIANIFKICRFPMARVMVSPSILTYR